MHYEISPVVTDCEVPMWPTAIQNITATKAFNIFIFQKLVIVINVINNDLSQHSKMVEYMKMKEINYVDID